MWKGQNEKTGRRGKEMQGQKGEKRQKRRKEEKGRLDGRDEKEKIISEMDKAKW